MHGQQSRKILTEEQQEMMRRGTRLMKQLVKNRETTDRVTRETRLRQTALLLMVNGDIGSLWNVRRELLWKNSPDHSTDAKVAEEEIAFAFQVLHENSAKSYAVWNHLAWAFFLFRNCCMSQSCSSPDEVLRLRNSIMSPAATSPATASPACPTATSPTATSPASAASPTASLARVSKQAARAEDAKMASLAACVESVVKQCRQLLVLDDRNFHCWGFLQDVYQVLEASAGPAKRTAVETELVLNMITRNTSNGSAWYFRRRVLESEPDADPVRLPLQAFYMDPADESVFIHLRYIIKNYKAMKTEVVRVHDGRRTEFWYKFEKPVHVSVLRKHFGGRWRLPRTMRQRPSGHREKFPHHGYSALWVTDAVVDDLPCRTWKVDEQLDGSFLFRVDELVCADRLLALRRLRNEVVRIAEIQETFEAKTCLPVLLRLCIDRTCGCLDFTQDLRTLYKAGRLVEYNRLLDHERSIESLRSLMCVDVDDSLLQVFSNIFDYREVLGLEDD